jgi:hypothetical protein
MTSWPAAVLLGCLLAGATACSPQVAGLAPGARWELTRVADAERQAGTIDQRRALVTTVNRALLMRAPADPLVPELFELVTQLSSRVESGEVSPNWAAYIYTVYQRDMARDRPDGLPQRSSDEVATELAGYVEFFHIRKRPDATGVSLGDILGSGSDGVRRHDMQDADRLRTPHEHAPVGP